MAPAPAVAAYVVKARLDEPPAAVLALARQKTMYGGRRIAPGDEIFVFASETSGGAGLVARGRVAEVEAVPRVEGIERQTPRVSVRVDRTGLARRPLGRAQLKPFAGRDDGRPETELHFKLYRQATDKIVGITEGTAAFLRGFF